MRIYAHRQPLPHSVVDRGTCQSDTAVGVPRDVARKMKLKKVRSLFEAREDIETTMKFIAKTSRTEAEFVLVKLQQIVRGQR